VKTLSFGADVSVLDNQEVQSLIRLNNENNPNLIRLLVTYQHKDHLHLVFPWADGNLQDFWKTEYPEPHSPARDRHLAKWVAQQCLGLALGLKAIHHNCVDRSQAKEQDLPFDASQKRHGRHGDFKPENILWFAQNGTRSPNNVSGVLKVSDFGFADFHASLSKSDIPRDRLRGMTPTYRAPEWDVTEKVSPAYDIWCFGCVLLEFVEWYLRGWQGVKAFEEKRIKDSRHVLIHYREDNFFNFTTSGEAVRQAVAKESVRLEIQDLRHDKKCSDFILDLLRFIEYQLLRMRPQERASCDTVVDKLQELCAKCEADPTYCTELQQRVPEKRNTDLSELALSLPAKIAEMETALAAGLKHTRSPSSNNATSRSNDNTPSVTVASNRSSVANCSSESIPRFYPLTAGGSFPAPTPTGSAHRPEISNLDDTSPTANPPPDASTALPMGLGIVREESATDPNLLSPPKVVPPSEHSDKTLEDSTANGKDKSEDNPPADINANMVSETRAKVEKTRNNDLEERDNVLQDQANMNVDGESRRKRFIREIRRTFECCWKL
jgi:hypothetical protein